MFIGETEFSSERCAGKMGRYEKFKAITGTPYPKIFLLISGAKGKEGLTKLRGKKKKKKLVEKIPQ